MLDEAVTEGKTRLDEPAAGEKMETFGSLFCGLELMHDAWPEMKHIFSVGGKDSNAQTVYPRLLA